jgi:hypothetical protein
VEFDCYTFFIPSELEENKKIFPHPKGEQKACLVKEPPKC